MMVVKEQCVKDEKEACRIMRVERVPQYLHSESKLETIITSKWNMLRENRWQIICSVWVEMLCYTVSNCSTDYHSEKIRRGGGLVTHVWDLLAHKTEISHQ